MFMHLNALEQIYVTLVTNPAYGQHSAISYVCLSRIPILYHESNSTPWVVVNTKSLCQYNKSLSIPWVHVCTLSLYNIPWIQVNTISPFQYHRSLFIPWVKVYTMSIHQYIINQWTYNESFTIPRVQIHTMIPTLQHSIIKIKVHK